MNLSLNKETRGHREQTVVASGEGPGRDGAEGWAEQMEAKTHRMGGSPGGSGVKNLPANTGDSSVIPGSGRSPEEGNGNTPLSSCLGNPMDRGAS